MKKEQKLETQQNSDSIADNLQVSPFAPNRLLSAASLKDGVGAYCKGGCGGIIYAVTNERMNDESAKKTLDWYWDNGHQLGRISKEDISKHWGCFCRR